MLTFHFYRGATMSFVGRHNTASVDMKRPLPARYNTALLPLVLLNNCAAINGPEIPSRLAKKEANPVAVPRTAAGNASGVHPKSYERVSFSDHVARTKKRTRLAHCGVEKALAKVLEHVETDVARLRVHDTVEEERDAHEHGRENEGPFSSNHRCPDQEDGENDGGNSGGVDDDVVDVRLF